MFILNTRTGTLHYQGLCPHAKIAIIDPQQYRCFETENDARADGALFVRWCKDCNKKRDQQHT